MTINTNIKTAKGHISVYGFRCGYIESYHRDDNNYITLSLEGTWHIQGYIEGVWVWEVEDRWETKAARKLYNSFVKSIKRQEKIEEGN